MTEPTKAAREAARLVAEDLFTSGIGKRADRLVLTDDTKIGDAKDLGGWCRGAAVDRVAAIIDRHTVPRAEADALAEAVEYEADNNCVDSRLWCALRNYRAARGGGA